MYTDVWRVKGLYTSVFLLLFETGLPVDLISKYAEHAVIVLCCQ